MDQTTKQIIRRLAKRQPRELIISDLSKRFRLRQTDAEKLVNEIEKRYQSTIEKRHRPFLILAWGSLALGGLTLVIIGVIESLMGQLSQSFKLPLSSAQAAVLIIPGLFACWAGIREVRRMARKSK